jgi:hypothetical protein
MASNKLGKIIRISMAKPQAPRIFAPSIESKTFAGFLTGTRVSLGKWALDTDRMHFVVSSRPEVCSPGDSVIIVEYGPDSPRYARILPYQKRYKIQD